MLTMASFRLPDPRFTEQTPDVAKFFRSIDEEQRKRRQAREQPPQTIFARPVFTATAERVAAEEALRDKYPRESAYNFERQAASLRAAADASDNTREEDALKQFATDFDQHANDDKERAQQLYLERKETYEADMAAQQRYLEASVRDAVSADDISRQLLLNKADSLLAMGKVLESRVIRDSVIRSQQRALK